MPFDYLRQDARRRIVVRIRGGVTTADAGTIADHLAKEARGYAVLYDLTWMTDAPRREELQHLTDYLQARVGHRPRAPIAIVAPAPALFTLAQRYATQLPRAVPMQVFRRIAAAERWLDASGDTSVLADATRARPGPGEQ